jgi:hypothetical protein
MRIDGEPRPVLQPQRLEALEQAAIHENAVAFAFQQIFRPGDGAGRAEKRQIQTHRGPSRRTPLMAITPGSPDEIVDQDHVTSAKEGAIDLTLVHIRDFA